MTIPTVSGAPSRKKSVDARVFVAAGVGGLIILIGLALLLTVFEAGVTAVLMIVPLLVLLAGLFCMKSADADTNATQPQAGLAQMLQQPIGHGSAAPAEATPAEDPEDNNLGGDAPTVRADRPRLRAAQAYDLNGLMRQRDNANPPQCPNCGQLARLSPNSDHSSGRCADCGAEWARSPVQPPTLVRSHVRTNVPTPTQPAGASTARPN